METELTILVAIEANKNVTQRILAKEANISLGAINVLLSKMVGTGLLKIERLNARSIRYMLTPQGVLEKAQKTYDYVKRTYESILRMKNELSRIVEDMPKNGTLWLYGEEDEICRMIILLLNDVTQGKAVAVKKIDTTDTIDEDSITLIWNNANADKFAGMRCVNILDRIL